MQPKKQIVGLPVYQPGKPIEEVKKEFNLKEVLKLASNENPLGTSPKAREAAIEEAANLSLYPDGASVALRESLAQFYQVEQEQFIFGTGSDEVIMLIGRAYLDYGSNSVMADPTFPIYKTNATIEGAAVIEVPLTEGNHDLARMQEAINEQTKVVWICNPNNPSGTYVSAQQLQAFLEQVSSDVLVVLDEAYYEYATAEDYPDSLPLLQKYSNLLVLRTFSKIYGLAALRIGYGVGHPDVIDKLNRVREPFNTTRVAQVAALAAIEDQQFVQRCRELNRAGLEQFYRAFQEMNLAYYPSQGNFILVNVGRPGNEVFDQLLREGIIVRSGEALGFPTHLRITVGTLEQNEKIIKALHKCLLQESS